MFKSTLLTIPLVAMATTLSAQTVIPLYKNKIPNSIPGPNQEKIDTSSSDNITRISNVSEPTLTVFLPSKGNGTAVIICPGGGYGILAVSHEGYDVAAELNKAGIAAFVLKYRLPSDKTMEYKEIGPLQDAQQAVKLVRESAQEWKIDPKRIGIAGFSAGGHLASTAGTHFNTPLIENKANTNLRPDFMILLYPVISFTDSMAHQGTLNNLLGPSPSQEKIKFYSNELQVTEQTPPAFLVHSSDDSTVKVGNSISFYQALQTNGIPAEMHIYQKGGHGYGLKNPTTPDLWMKRCINWMAGNGWLK